MIGSTAIKGPATASVIPLTPQCPGNSITLEEGSTSQVWPLFYKLCHACIFDMRQSYMFFVVIFCYHYFGCLSDLYRATVFVLGASQEWTV